MANTNSPNDNNNNKISTRQINPLLRPSLKTGLHARLASPTASVVDAFDASTMPHRLALMLDVSGSMRGDNIEHLRQATLAFVNACNVSDTAIALETFGDDNPHLCDLRAVYDPLITMSIMGLQAHGDTPLEEAMQFVLNNYAVTRGVIVSDGCADQPQACENMADNYHEALIPLDCVHIGDATQGESLLRTIAERTGGLYIKFANVSQFSKSFAYLSPAKRASLMLCDSNERAKLLGATEVK